MYNLGANSAYFVSFNQLGIKKIGDFLYFISRAFKTYPRHTRTTRVLFLAQLAYCQNRGDPILFLAYFNEEV